MGFGYLLGMPRTARVAPGGMVFHVLNRANNRDEMFETDEDYLAFLRVMRDTLEKSDGWTRKVDLSPFSTLFPRARAHAHHRSAWHSGMTGGAPPSPPVNLRARLRCLPAYLLTELRATRKPR